MQRIACNNGRSCLTELVFLAMPMLLLAIAAAPVAADPLVIPGGEVAAVAQLPITSVADFAAGHHDGTAVSEVDNAVDSGQLRLESGLEDLFFSASLDTIWDTVLPPAGYDPVIVDGILDVQERDDDDFARSAIMSRETFAAGLVCEVRAAIYPGSSFVNLGFTASTDSADEWLYFSTRGSGSGPVPTIFTSTRSANAGTVNVPTSVTLSEFHVFRIVWTADSVEFWVDDVMVDERTDVIFDIPQYLTFYKSDDSDSPYHVDWVRVTPYTAATAAYTSDVQDAGEAGRLWTRLTWEGDTPAAASAVFATRTGETVVPDATWSPWVDVAADAVASPPGRYLQYRASLATADSLASPVIDAVQLEFSYLDLTPPAVVATTPGPGAEGIGCLTSIAATFDEPIDPATVTAQSFTLTPSGGGPLPAAVGLDADGVTATLTPTASLLCATIYEARLTTDIADGDGNRLTADHVWTFTTVPPDLDPPTVLATEPVSGGVAVLPARPITVQFDEALDPATLTTASFTVTPRDGAPLPATVTYDPQNHRGILATAADLDLATIHDVRLTTDITDQVGNHLAADLTWTFTTRVDTVTVHTATSSTDFGAGTLANVVIAELDSSDVAGQLRLAGYLADRFDQPDLDPQWHATRPADYVPVIADGILDVQERDDEEFELSAIESYAEWGPGVVFEARAMFVPGSAFIDVGLDNNTLTNSQYAWFSTAGTGGVNGDQIIYARVREYDHTTVAIETSASFNQWHVFKIVWTHGQMDFYVDGVLEATHTDVLVTSAMHAAFYKSNNSDTPFYIDWVRVTPYTGASGEYTSPVLDGGLEPTAWLDLQWSGVAPLGTGVTFATRTGETASPDSTWSDWSNVAGADVTSPAARYAQYRALLTTDDPLVSPVIDAIYLTHGAPDDLAPPSVVARVPQEDAVDVPRDVVVGARFDEALDPNTIDGESITLTRVGGEAVAGVVSYDPQTLTATFVPDGDLAANAMFEVSVSGTIRDLAGNALAENYTWTFTTELGPIAAPDVPALTALLPNAPNPFNPATAIRFELARQQRVIVGIYGIDGRRVRTLVAEELAAGRHMRMWDGRDESGRMAPTGVYLLRLVTEDGNHNRKISMLK